MLDILASEFGQSGMSLRWLRGRESAGMLYARPRERDRTLPRQLLIGHCDTVWPVGTVSRMPVRVEGDALQGPGVFDMKGGLVQMIFALRALQAFGFRPPAESVVLINSDEEIGSPDSTPLIRRLARRGAGLRPGTCLRAVRQAEDGPQGVRRLHDHRPGAGRPRGH